MNYIDIVERFGAWLFGFLGEMLVIVPLFLLLTYKSRSNTRAAMVAGILAAFVWYTCTRESTRDLISACGEATLVFGLLYGSWLFKQRAQLTHHDLPEGDQDKSDGGE